MQYLTYIGFILHYWCVLGIQADANANMQMHHINNLREEVMEDFRYQWIWATYEVSYVQLCTAMSFSVHAFH